jgi:hypothetical protein
LSRESTLSASRIHFVEIGWFSDLLTICSIFSLVDGNREYHRAVDMRDMEKL